MIKGLLILAIVIFALNGAYQVSAPLIKNRLLVAKLAEATRNPGRKSPAEIHVEIMDYVKDKGIDLDESELMVYQGDDRKIHLAARYEARGAFWKYSRDYVFFPASDNQARLYWNQRRGAY